MTMSNVIFIYSEAYHTITYLKFEDNLLSDLFDQLATQSYLIGESDGICGCRVCAILGVMPTPVGVAQAIMRFNMHYITCLLCMKREGCARRINMNVMVMVE